MFDFTIKEEWKSTLEEHKNNKYDFELQLPYDTPDEVYTIISNLLKKGRFLYKLIKGEKLSLQTPTWICLSYTDVVEYLCAHKRENGIFWNILTREPEAVATERALLRREEQENYRYNTEEAFAAGEGFIVDDDGNWKPIGD